MGLVAIYGEEHMSGGRPSEAMPQVQRSSPVPRLPWQVRGSAPGPGERSPKPVLQEGKSGSCQVPSVST